MAFAAGQAKAGLRPIVDIYSTFLQRSYDQIFQEVALQNLPVTFMLDRSGLTGPDGPTHHGMFDLAILRVLPNLVVMAPGDASDLPSMLEFALTHDAPCAIRYPKAPAEKISRPRFPVQRGQAEVIDWGEDVCLLCCGPFLKVCIEAAERVTHEGLDVGVVNCRFVKPIDRETILHAIDGSSLVVTIEEAALMGGFGSAVLETVADAGRDVRKVVRLGVPDQFIEHGERDGLLRDLRLDVDGIVETCRRKIARRRRSVKIDGWQVS